MIVGVAAKVVFDGLKETELPLDEPLPEKEPRPETEPLATHDFC